MIKNLLTLFIVGCVCIVSQGCTYRAWFEGFKENQRQDCYKHMSQSDIQECLDRVNSMTYDQYMKERESSN